MICIILEMIKPDARVNTRDMKDKLRSIDISTFNGDVEDMLTEMEDLNSQILAEGEDHQDFNLDLLNVLKTVQDTAFIHTIDKLQDAYDAGEIVTPTEIIQKATRKYLNLIKCNEYKYTARKYLNLTTKTNQQQQQDSTIAEWRKTLIPGKLIVVRDNHTFHWCPHKQPERGFPNGLYVSSHAPDKHEAWSKNKRNFKSSKSKTPTSEKDSVPDQPQKQMVMTEKLRQVLTTTQPNLNSAQIENFIQSVLKE